MTIKHGLILNLEHGRVWEGWVQGCLVGVGLHRDIIEAAYEHHLAGTGAARITAERLRQLDSEGHTYAHDDEHTDRALAAAAYCYLGAYLDPEGDDSEPPAEWPWDATWWKPGSGPARMLAKAGALIAAELDRLDRVE